MKSPFYLSVNGSYGQGPYAKPEFTTLPQLLSHMDKLGIGQCVVNHNAARDLHPVFGNRFLLNDIEKTPGAKERVIPAFAANSSMLAGAGEMEHLIDAFASGKAHCLALFPKTNRYDLLEIERVFEPLRPYCPVVLIDITELGECQNERAPAPALQELIQLSARFPEFRFVIRKVMWWQFSNCLYALSKAKNVYLDISWLHTRNAIGIVAQQFGAERLVFGLGMKSHAGAAIASLCYADLPQSERDNVASNNFISLFADKHYREELSKNRRSLDNHVQNSFWNAFLDGKGVQNTLVIDAHTHIGPFARSWMVPNNEFDGQIREFEHDMARFGIDKVCSQSEAALFGPPIEGNRMLEQAIGNKKNRFRGNLVINPVYAELYTDEVLDDFFRGGYFCGMKLIPEYIGVDISDPCLDPIFKYANRHKLHILVHSWEGKHGTALQVAETAARYPDATFMIGHTGGGTVGRHQSEQIAQDPKYANCVFEFCGTFTTEVEWVETLQKIDYHRVIFGTDTIAHDIAWELGRLLSMDIPDEQLKMILGQNMQRILDRAQLPQ